MPIEALRKRLEKPTRATWLSQRKKLKPVKKVVFDAELINDENTKYCCPDVLNAIPLIVWLCNANGKIIAFNKEWYAHTGTSEKRRQVVMSRHVHEEDLRVLAHMLKAKEEKTEQVRLRSKSGAYEWFQIKMSQLAPRKGMEEGLWLCTATNIHAQKDAEKSLSAARVSLQIDKAKDDALMESLGEAVIATDMDERIIFANYSAEEMFGLKAKEMIGVLFSDSFDIYDKLGNAISSRDFLIPSVLRTGKKATATNYYFTTPKKKKFPASVTTSPIVMDGATIGSVSIFRNTRREAQIDKMKSEFVSLASHQLRTPLTAVKLFTEMLLADQVIKRNMEQRDMLESIERANEKMIRLVDNLLDVANMEAGRMWVEPTLLSPSEFIESVVEETKPLAHSREVDVEYKHSQKDEREIDTDPYLLRQILSNIITNAIEYSRKDSKVFVKVSWNEGKECVISVQDHGIGITKTAQREIFNRFFRAENAIKFKTESSGLGLYVCKMMVEVLGGKITFNSEIQKGTTFFIHLPIKSGKTALRKVKGF